MLPHLSEELWERLGNQGSNAYETWPVANTKYLMDDNVTLAVQVNGKMRGRIELGMDSLKEDAGHGYATREHFKVRA